ncbi:MAG: UDP-3-O-(3-hydroxymyristoyl)glucosamine N-acyltransferase [Candidatus Kapabacteria bacterium]|nr:UDP-3-O-(3-hydroxymyristoyl)glucosamine N-acyltransferase [Candidatus Kapabacteria bacterium]
MIRFSLTVQEIAAITNGTVVGDPQRIVTGLHNIESASSSMISFYAQKKFRRALEESTATAIIVPNADDCLYTDRTTYIVHPDPHRAFVALCHNLLQTKKHALHPAIIHPTAHIHSTAVIHDGCIIQEDVIIDAYCVLGMNVTVGAATHLYPHVTVYDNCEIGRDCVIHAGAVIGSDGFGYLQNSDGSYLKIPQMGNVQIGNACEIGANTTIDRAALGSTHIGERVKIDNLVHIAHNVVIGDDTAIAAQSGIAGAAVLGRRNRIAGQVGIVGYITLCDDVTVGAQSGVSKSITKPGIYSGSPAVPIAQRLQQEASVRRIAANLPQIETLLSSTTSGSSHPPQS